MLQCMSPLLALGWHNRPVRLVSGVGAKSRPDMLNLRLSGHDPELSLTLKFRRQLQACGKLMKDAVLDTRGCLGRG